MSEQYWAGKPSNEVIQEFKSRIDSYENVLSTTGITETVNKSLRNYYGSAYIEEAGSQGELLKVHVNDFQSLVNSTVSLVTSSRPAWEARATNSDAKSQAQTILASSVLEYYMRAHRLERMTKDALTDALIAKESWIGCTWNPSIGNAIAVDPETGMPVTEGDLEFKLFRIFDVIRDPRKEGKPDWVITRELVNKWDLAARYPEHESDILSSTSQRDYSTYNTRNLIGDKSDDLIDFYTFYHDPKPSMPKGRITQF